jgi:hypothetical protein
VFRRHADQEIRVGTDSAIGQMVVGEADQDIRPRLDQLLPQAL